MSVTLKTMQSTRQEDRLAREAKKQALKDINAEFEKEKDHEIRRAKNVEQTIKKYLDKALGKVVGRVNNYVSAEDEEYYAKRALKYVQLAGKKETLDPIKDYSEINGINYIRRVIWNEFEQLTTPYKKEEV